MQPKTKKKLIIADSALLLFMIIGIAFAWFASNFTNSVNSNEVTVVSDGALQLSVDTGESKSWSNSIKLSDKQAFNQVKFLDITGSGDGNFLRPTLEQQVGFATVVTGDNTKWTTPKASDFSDSTVIGDYVKFTLYMRSEDPLDVYLGEDSSVEPVAKVLKGENAENVSPFSTSPNYFSKDIVVGAVRVSACKTGQTGEENRLFTWIPRPDIFVNNAEAFTFEHILLNQTSGDSFNHTYYDSNTATSTTNLTNNIITGKINDSKKRPLATLEKAQQSDEFYTGSVDFYIWLEGCDNEARRAFVDGQFKVYLNIISQDIAAAENP